MQARPGDDRHNQERHSKLGSSAIADLSTHSDPKPGDCKRDKRMGRTRLARQDLRGFRKTMGGTQAEGPALTSQAEPCELRPAHAAPWQLIRQVPTPKPDATSRHAPLSP